MQSCQFGKSVIERGSGKFSFARPAAVSSAELQYSCSRPSSLRNRNTARCWQWISVVGVCECSCLLLEHWHTNSVAPRARPFNSTSTPRRRDGFFSFRTFQR